MHIGSYTLINSRSRINNTCSNLNNFLNANETHHLSHTKSSIYFHVDCILNHFQVVCMDTEQGGKARN